MDRIETPGSSYSEKTVELLDDIIHRVGLPNNIITDLGSTFTGCNFWDFYDERCISVKYVSVAHRRANGQVERANGTILYALKKQKQTGKWLKELAVVVSGLRT